MRSIGLCLGILATAGWLISGCGGDDDDDNPMMPDGTDGVSMVVTRGESGTLENDDGVRLEISPGTVPTTSDSMPGAIQQLLDVGGQLAAVGIDDLVLFLDADRQLWKAHGGLLCKRGASLAGVFLGTSP